MDDALSCAAAPALAAMGFTEQQVRKAIVHCGGDDAGSCADFILQNAAEPDEFWSAESPSQTSAAPLQGGTAAVDRAGSADAETSATTGADSAAPTTVAAASDGTAPANLMRALTEILGFTQQQANKAIAQCGEDASSCADFTVRNLSQPDEFWSMDEAADPTAATAGTLVS
jgi:Holliday junction resolvasome RuvABC DNA-binding subunit